MTDPLAVLQAALADRYVVERRIGEGGMALVFLADDRRHHRAVAIKVLRPEVAAAIGPDRFLREIRFAAELNHPHIVPLFDSGIVPAGEQHSALPYYVMPWLPGESLRDRLAREGALPIEEAVGIARQVAAALAYAHGHGIIHRDIKPANILLSEGEAVVADFGIARAVDQAGETEEITDSGLTLGTPAYMAPEQTMADTQLDGRADIYALGCVLYEMLGGSPPFSGSTAHVILARHRTDPPPPLRTLRGTVPPAVETAVMRALAKSPADRYRTAAEMARTLGSGSGSNPAITAETTIEAAPAGKRFVAAGALILLALLAVALWVSSSSGREDRTIGIASLGTRAQLDTSRYAVAPFVYDSAIPVRIHEDQLLLDALSRWTGLTVVDRSQFGEAMDHLPPDRLTGSMPPARAAAATLGAGRLVHGTVSEVAGEYRINALLMETGTGAVLDRRSARIPPSLDGIDATFIALADSLLLRNGGFALDDPGADPSRSLPARQAFASGHEAVLEWDLDRADSAFSAALSHDENYARAALWLALTRSWKARPVAEWSSLARRAQAGGDRLPARDALMAHAVSARAAGDMAAACRVWESIARASPDDFLGWYGRADCQFADDGVLPDRRSPSGWRFRSSWNAALEAYQRAFELRPSIHRALGSDAFGSLRRRFLTSENARRGGKAVPPDTGSFGATPLWIRDTLALVPYRLRDLSRMQARPQEIIEGRAQLRRRLTETARAWAAAYPRSADAREVLALALEMAGDSRAVDTLLAARALATDPAQRTRLAATEVWMRLRRSRSGRLEELGNVRRLADSLLRLPASAAFDPGDRAGLAALTGQTSLAARLAESGALRDVLGVQPALSPAAEMLVIASAVPGERARLDALERSLQATIDRSLDSPQREGERMQWLAYSMMLAFPEVPSSRLPSLAGQGDYLVDAAVALGKGDSATVRRLLRESRRARARLEQRGVSLDALPAEAALHAAVGDTAGAVRLLEESFDGLAVAGPGSVEHPAKAAGLVRAAILRSTLAASAGDSATARRWRSMAEVLWRDGDPGAQSILSGGRP